MQAALIHLAPSLFPSPLLLHEMEIMTTDYTLFCRIWTDSFSYLAVSVWTWSGGLNPETNTMVSGCILQFRKVNPHPWILSGRGVQIKLSRWRETGDLRVMCTVQCHFLFFFPLFLQWTPPGAQKPGHARSPVERHLHSLSQYWRHERTCLKPIAEDRSIHVSCARWGKGFSTFPSSSARICL